MLRTDGALPFFGNLSEIRGSHEAAYLASAFWYGCWEIHKGSEKWIQQVFIIKQIVNKDEKILQEQEETFGKCQRIQPPMGMWTIHFSV